MKPSTLAVLTLVIALGGGCSSALATGPNSAILGTWRSASGLEQFIEVTPLRMRTFTWVPSGECYRVFEYPLREEVQASAVGVENLYGTGDRTWVLKSESGGTLTAERRGLGEASTRTYERRPDWTGTACV